MEKKLKITFEKGGIVYARLLRDKAPKTVALLEESLPRREKLLHARYAGSALFIDTRFTEVERENIINEKCPGKLSMTLGKPIFVGKAIHFWYDEPIYSVKDENWFGVVDENCLATLKEAGHRVETVGPEYALFELSDEA